ncbi:MAG: prepilin-type N-terminal cleavage/methylation domain-containing protein [Gallionella sp.]|nr:prepilin-type N-terminal cleavage/methylation domain-containing protein [Gallionella sp.]
MKRNQSGFTLIEIAIVLVIIGLLLGGVLKGQELINSAKVKNLATDFKNIPIYIYGYQDKYKALPGDDANAVGHLGAAASQVTGTTTVGNGIINGPWNTTGGQSVNGVTVGAANDESYLFWQHIRLAGFGPGSTDPSNPSGYIPTNAVGGTIGVTNSGPDLPITGMVGTYIVCSSAIPFKFAKQLDTTLDDGDTAKGSVQVTAQYGAANYGTAIPTVGNATTNDDTPVTVCMGY